MDDCCEIRTDLPTDQRRVLQIVLRLNGVMFVVEFGAGLAAHSTALLADSVDMLGDAIVYGASLYTVARGRVWQARVAFLKGLIMALCSRNDVVANVGVLLAAGAVALSHSGWPDIVVGLAIASLFATSAIRVMGGALRALRAAAI